jgi:proteasome lid subunit RPN8/RPN11
MAGTKEQQSFHSHVDENILASDCDIHYVYNMFDFHYLICSDGLGVTMKAVHRCQWQMMKNIV